MGIYLLNGLNFLHVSNLLYIRGPNRQTSGESASLPQYDEGTESAEVATSVRGPILKCTRERHGTPGSARDQPGNRKERPRP